MTITQSQIDLLKPGMRVRLSFTNPNSFDGSQPPVEGELEKRLHGLELLPGDGRPTRSLTYQGQVFKGENRSIEILSYDPPLEPWFVNAPASREPREGDVVSYDYLKLDLSTIPLLFIHTGIEEWAGATVGGAPTPWRPLRSTGAHDTGPIRNRGKLTLLIDGSTDRPYINPEAS